MTPLYTSRSAAEAAAERIRIYAQPQRLMILSFLTTGEHTVSEIEEATGVTQPALSQQLAELRRADIVVTRREAKSVYYRLSSDWQLQCIRNIEAMANRGPFQPLQSQPAQSDQPATTPNKRAIGAASFAVIE